MYNNPLSVLLWLAVFVVVVLLLLKLVAVA
jgi:hypothetical protein